MLACCLGFVPLTEVSGFLSFFQRSKEVEVAKNERKEKPTLSLSLSRKATIKILTGSPGSADDPAGP